jgi:hypothetical protein
MDCVYHAYADNLEWLGIRATLVDYECYKLLKRWTHGSKPQYTFGGVAPFIVSRLASLHGLPTFTVYKIYTPELHIEVAKKYYSSHYKRLRAIINHTEWHEVDSIRIEPAIYLLLTESHAVFSERVPRYGIPVTAIQIGH